MSGANVGDSAGLSVTSVEAGSASTVALEAAVAEGPDSGTGSDGGGVAGVGDAGAGVVGLGVLGCVGFGLFVDLTVCARIRFSAAANAFVARRRQAAAF